MSMAQGGYRKPGSPAPVSGPGALSERTDGGPTQPAQYMSGLPYGEGADFYDIQTSAPMEAAPTGTPNGSSAVQAAAPSSQIIPLDAPSMNPDEPVTAGIDYGPGPGSAALGMAANQGRISDSLAQMLPYDTTGEIAVLYQLALSKGM